MGRGGQRRAELWGCRLAAHDGRRHGEPPRARVRTHAGAGARGAETARRTRTRAANPCPGDAAKARRALAKPSGGCRRRSPVRARFCRQRGELVAERAVRARRAAAGAGSPCGPVGAGPRSLPASKPAPGVACFPCSALSRARGASRPPSKRASGGACCADPSADATGRRGRSSRRAPGRVGARIRPAHLQDAVRGSAARAAPPAARGRCLGR